jgi:hypothetical protein
MRNREVEGTYGSGMTPCTVFVYENYRGSRWYAVEGSTGVNCTYDDIEDGVDVEELSDHDFFTSSFKINSLEELEKAVEE